MLNEALVLSGEGAGERGGEGRCPQLPLLFLSPKWFVTPPPAIPPNPFPPPLPLTPHQLNPGQMAANSAGASEHSLGGEPHSRAAYVSSQARKVRPSKWSQRENLGSGCTFLRGGGGGEGPWGRSKLFVLRIVDVKAKLGHLHARLRTPPWRREPPPAALLLRPLTPPTWSSNPLVSRKHLWLNPRPPGLMLHSPRRHRVGREPRSGDP